MEKKKALGHLGMVILIAAAVIGAVKLQGCTKVECTEVSYLPGRCG